MNLEEFDKLANGIYVVHWEDGSKSLAMKGEAVIPTRPEEEPRPWFVPMTWSNVEYSPLSRRDLQDTLEDVVAMLPLHLNLDIDLSLSMALQVLVSSAFKEFKDIRDTHPSSPELRLCLFFTETGGVGLYGCQALFGADSSKGVYYHTPPVANAGKVVGTVTSRLQEAFQQFRADVSSFVTPVLERQMAEAETTARIAQLEKKMEALAVQQTELGRQWDDCRQELMDIKSGEHHPNG